MSRPKGADKTGGRKAGTPNKVSSNLKTAIMKAFALGDDELGIPTGDVWLMELKRDNPNTFATLLKPILGTFIHAEVVTTQKVVEINMVGFDPDVLIGPPPLTLEHVDNDA